METLTSSVRFIFLSLLMYHYSVASERITNICVSPSGIDSKSCGNGSQPCHSLDFAISLARERGANSTQITAAKGNYTLTQSHSFTNVENFGLVGQGSTPDDVEITCETNVSFSFILSDNIVFERITLQKCGGWHRSAVGAEKPYRGLNGVNFITTLDFRYCKNIRLDRVEISSSRGLAVNCYDCGGVVNFTNSVFADNFARYSNATQTNQSLNLGDYFVADQRKDYVFSGGGVYLGLDPYGSNTVNVTPSKHESFQHNNTYHFRDCRFLRNEAVWSNKSKQRDFVDTPELPFSRGGGIAIFFRSNASGCIVDIESCVFIRNRAHWGGGLALEMREGTRRNTFTIKNTLFDSNDGLLAGGGARIGNRIKGDGRDLNTFTASNCTFVNNKAIWGGGTSIFGTTIPDTSTSHDVTQFSFNRCRWINNLGTVGAAMGAFLSNQNEDQIGPEIPYHISFTFSMFQGNQVIRMEELVTIGEGALYSIQVPLIFRGNVTFINNTNSALALDGSTMEIYDNVFFINNRGFRGGAMAMYGRSRIVFNKNSFLLFKGNECEDRGGALYIYAPGPPLVGFNATGINTHICFFGYSEPSVDFDDWKTKVVFQGNKATFAGDSVFATTLKNCRRAGEPRQNNSVLQWKFVEFRNADGKRTSLSKEVTTDPVNITLDREDWQVAPSEAFNASVSLLDEIGNSVVGIVNIKIIPLQNPFSVRLYTPSPLFIANGSISYVTLVGYTGEKFSVKLDYMGRQRLTETITDLSLKACNPGFTASKQGDECVCTDSTDYGVSRCKSDGKTFFLTQGYWAGRVDGQFVTHFCPTGYCDVSKYDGRELRYNSTNICNEHRDQTSVLCGECEPNYGVLFGGERCSNTCSNWYLLLLILYGVILLFVVMGVMLINLDFFTGYLNAWLYSYQVMKVITPDGFTFDPVIEFLIGLGNFQLKTGRGGICFAAGLDDADKLVIMYALPTYVLVLVMMLARAVGNHPNWWFSKRVRAAPFRAFCTIFVLCYTDITIISLRILNPAKVGSKLVVYANGNIDYFSGKHLGYGILAILYILIVVLPLPLILLCRPFLTRRLFPVLNLNRWKPIFDALQSCFKDDFRWCAALYFLCRFALMSFNTFIPSGPVKRAILESACVLILLIFAYLRPYKEAADVKEDEESYEWINKSDVALLATLSLIAIFSSQADSSLSTSTRIGLSVFVDVLAYIPLVVLVMVTCRSVRRWREVRKLRNELHEPELSVTDMSDETTVQENQPA